MIVIPIVGNSKRFFEVGYNQVKYKLPLKNNKTVFENILTYVPNDQKLLIICNKKFKDSKFLRELCVKLSFDTFEVIEIGDTDGQLTSVELGIAKSSFNDDEELWIYNGDTVRKIPFVFDFEGDAMIEVFSEQGDHWSFVDQIGRVQKIEEKVRISNFCCSGLYGFKSLSQFFYYSKLTDKEKGERYVAPIYKKMINDGKIVTSFLNNRKNFMLCGTPEEYEKSIHLDI